MSLLERTPHSHAEPQPINLQKRNECMLAKMGTEKLENWAERKKHVNKHGESYLRSRSTNSAFKKQSEGLGSILICLMTLKI